MNEMCYERTIDPRYGNYCSLEKGHDGPHLACWSNMIIPGRVIGLSEEWEDGSMNDPSYALGYAMGSMGYPFFKGRYRVLSKQNPTLQAEDFRRELYDLGYADGKGDRELDSGIKNS